LLGQISGLTAGQLNEIPKGFNNNIIWNLGHLICAEQSICYLRAGQSITVDDNYFSPYRTTTRPEAFVDNEEIEVIKKLFIGSIDELQADFDKAIFDNYSPSENIVRVYGVELNNIDDALEFLLYHEGFHSGYILALKRNILS
jgi:hypothetical protein